MNLIIHHWDTDGICSATLIAKVLQDDWTNCTPPVGVFDFDAKIWRIIERAEKSTLWISMHQMSWKRFQNQPYL